MQTRFFPAIIERGATCFGVFFPDFPGCVTVGDTLDEAMLNAEEALAAHAELMLADGDPIPEPTEPAAAPRDPEVDEVARVLVRLDLPGKAKPINITLPEGLIARIDRAAEAMGHTRSSFLAEGARRLLREARTPPRAEARRAATKRLVRRKGRRRA